jgi:spore maturation protein SpmA
MAELFALLLVGSIMLPFAKSSVEVINYNIFGRHASNHQILFVWLIATLCFWYGILPY